MFTFRTIRIAELTLAVATLALAAGPAAAQKGSTQEWLDNCRSDWSGDRSRFCEVRTLTLRAPGGALAVDGLENGGITVTGGDVSNVRVEALVQASAVSAREAEDIAKQVRIVTESGRIRAEAPPSGQSSWSVSYRITVPRHSSLGLQAHNGGISIEDVTGQLKLDTHNGGIHLADVGGDVRGETTNGGIHVDLTGDHYEGGALINVATHNGRVQVRRAS
jgi:hypothetical protein